jgi:uncharacterized protein YceH (UPF0502 family)
LDGAARRCENRVDGSAEARSSKEDASAVVRVPSREPGVTPVFGSAKRIQALGASELRVLGCLLEKQRTTPDQYPLSLNALRLACNQSTNREPVVDYDEATIRDALHRLERRGLVRLASGSRAAKYRHLLAEALPLSEGEQAVMTVLMLRGAQTPGELKQRADRMHAFADLAAVNETLERLIERELVVRLERRPGQKEERYAQLLEEDEHDDASAPSAAASGDQAVTGEGNGDRSADDPPASSSAGAANGGGQSASEHELSGLRERIERLEAEVAELRAAMRHASPSAPNVPSREIDDPRRFDPRL